MTNKPTVQFSDAQLNLRMAPQPFWPPAEASPMWDKLWNVLGMCWQLVRDADLKVQQVKNRPELSVIGVKTELGKIAMSTIQLLDVTPGLEDAQKAVDRFVADAQSKTKLAEKVKPSGPFTAADAVSAEIRAFIRKQESPLNYAYKHRSDPAVYLAITSAPAFLSGLTDQEREQYTGVAASSMWPDEMKAVAEAQKAREHVALVVRRAKDMVVELSSGTVIKVAENEYALNTKARAA